jgi:hypothetical protein
MLLLFTIAKSLILVHGNVEKELADRKGEDFGKVLSYQWVELGGDWNLVKLKYYEPVKNAPIFSIKDERDKFEKIIDSSKFSYKAAQSDPNLLFSAGGNCQAVSLYLYDTFKKNKLKTGLGLDLGIDHMYTWVIVNGIKYKVDLVNNVVEAMS